MPNPKNEYCITRHSHKGKEVSWFVQICRTKKVRAYFLDNNYGGEEASLKEARAFRDKFIEENRPITKKQKATTVAVNNTSGIPGVSRITHKNNNKHSDIPYYLWVAHCKINGSYKRKSFAINRYGEEKAKRLAINARREFEKQIIGYVDPRVKRRVEAKAEQDSIHY